MWPRAALRLRSYEIDSSKLLQWCNNCLEASLVDFAVRYAKAQRGSSYGIPGRHTIALEMLAELGNCVSLTMTAKKQTGGMKLVLSFDKHLVGALQSKIKRLECSLSRQLCVVSNLIAKLATGEEQTTTEPPYNEGYVNADLQERFKMYTTQNNLMLPQTQTNEVLAPIFNLS